MIYSDVAEELGLWLACLNLENIYGTQDSLEATFKEALKHNDPIKVRIHFITEMREGYTGSKAVERLGKSRRVLFAATAGESAIELFQIYSHLAKIYALAGKTEQARDTYQIMLKKFKQNRDVSNNFGEVCDLASIKLIRSLFEPSQARQDDFAGLD